MNDDNTMPLCRSLAFIVRIKNRKEKNIFFPVSSIAACSIVCASIVHPLFKIIVKKKKRGQKSKLTLKVALSMPVRVHWKQVI